MAETDMGAQALEQGYFGEGPDQIENEAYTVSGQGPKTAKREREQLHELRAAAVEASQFEEPPAKASKSSSSSGSSSSGSSGS